MRIEQHSCPGRIVAEVVSGSEPIGRPLRVEPTPGGRQELERLRCVNDRLARSAETIAGLGQTEQAQAPINAGRLGVEDRLETIRRRLPVARCEAELGIQTRPMGVRVGEEGARDRPEAAGDEA